MMGKFYTRVYTSESPKETKLFEYRLSKEGFRYKRKCESGIVLEDSIGRTAKIEFKY